MKTCIPFFLLLWLCHTATAQNNVPIADIKAFMQLHTGMNEDEATRFIARQWPQNNVTDTGPLRVYVIGQPDDDETLSGALRLLVYYMGGELSSKEMRFSMKREQVRGTLDSMKAALIKAYGQPTLDSTMTVIGLEGPAKVYSWTFTGTSDKDIYRVDLAAYKLKLRRDYTILAAVFTNRYQQMQPVRNYLHY